MPWTGRKGIHVNALAPGFFPSEMTERTPRATWISMLTRARRADTGEPAELITALVFLASDAPPQAVPPVTAVDGGLPACLRGPGRTRAPVVTVLLPSACRTAGPVAQRQVGGARSTSHSAGPVGRSTQLQRAGEAWGRPASRESPAHDPVLPLARPGVATASS